MKTRDEAIRDYAHGAAEQCEALAEKMMHVIDGMDDDGDPETEALRGIARDPDGRSMLVFAEPGVTNARSVVFVDDILALAKLLNGEVQVRDE
jgi:hypothetical protein